MNKPLLLLPLTALLAVACTKEDVEPTPGPAPATWLGFTRMFDYVGTGALRDTSYFDNELKGFAQLDPNGLLLKLENASGKEHLSFRVRAGQLPAQMVGTFVLDNNVRTGEVSYLYQLQKTSSGSAYSMLGNDISPTAGTFTITEYNAKLNLISGSYNFKFNGVSDPTVSSLEPNRRRCDVILAGAFGNVKLQKLD